MSENDLNTLPDSKCFSKWWNIIEKIKNPLFCKNPAFKLTYIFFQFKTIRNKYFFNINISIPDINIKIIIEKLWFILPKEIRSVIYVLKVNKVHTFIYWYLWELFWIWYNKNVTETIFIDVFIYFIINLNFDQRTIYLSLSKSCNFRQVSRISRRMAI